MSKPIQILLSALLNVSVVAQGHGAQPLKAEVINIGWNLDEVKPGMAAVLVEENGQFSVRKVKLIVKHVQSENENDDSGFFVSVPLPKSCKAILGWRGINQIKPSKRILNFQLPPLADQYNFNTQIMKFKAVPVEFVIERLSVDKQKVTIRSGSAQQEIFNSFPHYSGFWSAVWAGDLDGDGKLDLITQHEGFGEYVQARVITLWLSSLAEADALLGVAGSKTVYVGGC